MADIFLPDLVEETKVGIFARHASRATLPILVAPTTTDRAAATNRVRRHLVTVACASLKDYAFAFDSSFLAPDSAEGIANLAKLLALYPGGPISIFGHADPEGRTLYNKWLSERRARAVFGLLLKRVSVWEHLYSHQDGASGDRWGKASLQVMLGALGHDPGNTEGRWDTASRRALGAFLAGVPGADGPPADDSKAARAKLFRAYMDLLTPADPKDPSQRWQLQPSDFLGAAKAEMGAPGDLQGCSEFNPQLVFAKNESDGYRKGGKDGEEARNRANEPNRRVVIYVFEPGTALPTAWPCPGAASSKAISGCEDRLWSDAKDRRETEFVAHRRRFGREVPPGKALLSSGDLMLALKMAAVETTFGCRFYHGLALHSPCERDLQMWVVRLWAGGREAPLAGARYAATVGTDPDAPVIRSTTSASGIIGLPRFDDRTTITLKIDVGPALIPDFPASRAGREIQPTNPDRQRPGDPTSTGAESAVADSAPATPTAESSSSTADGPPPSTTDTAAWPGEERFMTLVLDAGTLRRIAAPPPDATPSDDPGAEFDAADEPPVTPDERDAAAGQRLRNLAFGGADLEIDPVARRAAIRRFQLEFRDAKDATGELDQETIDRLEARYGDRIETERPPV